MKKTKILVLASAFLFSVLSFTGCGSSSSSSSESSFKITGDKTYVSPKNVSAADAVNQSTGLEANWWRKSSFYHIWVKAFNSADSTYSCGDIKGVTAKLDYIKDTVGCDAIWLSPIFKCKYTGTGNSVNMHGYDTTDYYTINPYFGSEDDLVELINACHTKGMKIIFDFVPNHTATDNAWFTNSAAGKTVNGVDYTDWYVWSDTKKQIINGMKSVENSWHTLSGAHAAYYYGCFDSGMPDLNYGRFEVREEMKNVARYWLNKGFDGLRLDGARYLCEQDGIGYDTEATHAFFKELRAELDKYASPKFMVCEAWIQNNRTSLDKYLGDGDEFNVAFDFDAGIPCIQSVAYGYDSTGSTMRPNPSSSKSYGSFLGNHDEYTATINGKGYIRFGSALSKDALLIREAIGLSLMRPTIPFIYYGNEFGMPEYGTSGDMRARGPMNWSPDTDQTTTITMNKAFLDIRKAYPEVFQSGSVTKLSSDDSSVMGYVLSGSDATLLCVFSLSNTSKTTVNLSGYSVASADLLLGGGSNKTDLSFSGSKITVSELGPRAVRVYLLSADDGKSPYYTGEETYGSSHTIPVASSYTNMYLRGTFDNWADNSMTCDTSTGKVIWTASKTLTSGTTYQFQFRGDSSAYFSGANLTIGTDITDSGSSSNHNLLYTPSESGTYTFTFNETDMSCSVAKNS